MRRALWALLALTAGSCSFTTGTGFTECDSDAQCGAARVCVEHYCIPLPDDCRKQEGAFDTSDRIPILAALPLSDGRDGGTIVQPELLRLNAIRLALGEVNEVQGLRRRRFGLFVCDTAGRDELLTQQVAWFVDHLQVPVVITSGNGQTRGAALEPTRTAAKTLVISADSTGVELIDLYSSDHSVWRVAPPDTLQAQVLARVMNTEALYSSAQTVGVIYPADAGKPFAEEVKLELVKTGKQPVMIGFTASATGGMVDANWVRNELVPSGATASVIIALPVDLKGIVGSISASPSLAGHAILLTDRSRDPSIVDSTTLPGLAGMMGTAPAQGAGDEFSAFRDAFMSRFHDDAGVALDPRDATFTSHSYDAAYLVMLAAAWATHSGPDVTGEALSEGLAKVSDKSALVRQLLPTGWEDASTTLANGRAIDVEGSSGPLDFNLQTGAPPTPYELWQVTPDGGLTTVRLINP